MSSMKEKSMKRKLFGASEHDDKSDTNAASAEKKRRRKNAVETPKHCPLSERQQMALLMQMTSVENSPEPASPPPNIRRTPGGSGRKDRVHRRNERGETLLHLSTIKGDLEAMKELIKQGAEVNVQDFAGWTPLHEACNHGHQEITQYLLEVGANVNSRGLEDDTPLHDAVTNSHRDLVELLLKHGANPLLKNKRGERPLDIAEDQVIRELMQNEVITSEDSESEMDIPSPNKSESSRKPVAKIRTISTSSSNRELFKSQAGSSKKKRRKLKNGLSKMTVLTSNSSSDSSDDSDDSSLEKKLHNSTSLNTPRSNGCGQGVGKTPSSTAPPLQLPKTKLKKKRIKEVSGKSRVPFFKKALSDLATSSDASSDCDIKTKWKEKNGSISKNNPSLFLKDERKEHPKGKSLYSNVKPHLNETPSTAQAHYIKKKPSYSEVPKKPQLYSSEKEVSEVKIKTHRSSDDALSIKPSSTNLVLTTSANPKPNGLVSNTCNDASSSPNKKAAESIYDFSLPTDDFTDIGAISLKQKFKDKASDLFDVLCLGKPSQNVEIETNNNTVSPKPVEYSAPLKEKNTAVKVQQKDDYFQMTATQTTEEKELGLDRNHNKIVGSDSSAGIMTTPCATPKQKGNSVIPTEKKINSLPVPEKHNIVTKDVKQMTVAAENSIITIKTEIKSEKKVKRQHNVDSPKKSTQSSSANNNSKTDSVKKQLLKGEHSAESKVVKHKTTETGDAKPSGINKNSSSLVKKKKKHKHSKHSHSDSHRSKVTLNESLSSEKSSTSEKNRSAAAHSKTPLKRVDSTKSDSVKLQSGSSSRKSSNEGKTESAISARKKARSTDSTSSETSVKSAKHNNMSSITKSAKTMSSNSQEKQVTSNSTKKDKPEAKKIALISDTSFFLSEFNNVSIQRITEKKMKQKRKKKLLLQQQLKLKVQSSLEATPKDSKTTSSTSNTPITGGITGVKTMTPFFPSEYPSSDQGKRQTHLSPHSAGAPIPNHAGLLQPLVDPNMPQTSWDHGTPEERSGFSQSIFRSPLLAARSNSHVDSRVGNIQPENWKHPENLAFSVNDQRHLPVQRSLSFSSSDGSTHFHPDAKQYIQHEAAVQPRQPINLPVENRTQQNYHVTPIPHSYVDESLLSTSKYPPATIVNAEGNQNVVVNQPSVVQAGNALPPTVVPFSNNIVITPQTSDLQPPITTVAETSSENNSIAINSIPQSVLEVKSNDNDNPGQEEASEQKEPESEQVNLENKEAVEEVKSSAVDEVSEPTGPTISKEEVERKLALEKYVKERLSQLEAVIEEPEPRRLPVFIPLDKLRRAKKDPMQDRLNVYEEWAIIQDQINERRKKYSTVVIPQAPECYWEYMTFTGGYLLSGSRESWLSVPVLAPPPSLNEEMHSLFVDHEKERVKLRLQHATQREKLIVACEQEIMRVHSRAARMIQNQQIPLSACSVLLDKEIYNVERRNKKVQEENNTNRTASIRDRFNTRMFLSWLQDVDDKYRKMKNALLARQRHESQALHAVQRTEWLLKLQEAEHKGQQRWSYTKPEDVNELHVPLVNISDDFDLLPG